MPPDGCSHTGGLCSSGIVDQTAQADQFCILAGGAYPVGQKNHPQAAVGVQSNAGAGEAGMTVGAGTHTITQKTLGSAG